MQRILGSELTLHKLEVLCLVGKLESVSKAAEQLGLAQPVVTAHIRAIEDKLGTKVTGKQGRNIAFTDEGRRVLLWAEDVITRTRELQRELRDTAAGVEGSVKIGSSMSVGSYVLPDMLVDFRKLSPTGEIGVITSTPKGVTEAINAGAVDFGVTFLDINHDLHDLDASPVGRDELILVAAPVRDLPAKLSLSDLVSLPFVTAAHGSTRRQIEDSALNDVGISRKNIVMELGHAHAIVRAAERNLGIAFVFRSSAEEALHAGTLKLVSVNQFQIMPTLYMLKRNRKMFSSFQQRLFDMLGDQLRQRSLQNVSDIRNI